MKIVIIGSVAAGTSVAAKARRNDETAEIVVYEQGEDISYSVCGMPYALGGEVESIDQLIPRNPEWFKKRFDFSIHTGHHVTAIHPLAKEIEVYNKQANQGFRESYDKLVLATGSYAVSVPPFTLKDYTNVFHVRTMEQTKTIGRYLSQNDVKHATVIGSGFIGLEMVEQLKKKGYEVALIEAAGQVFPKMDADMSVHIEKEVIKNDVAIHLNTTVEEIDGEQSVNAVQLSSGEIIQTDLVISAVGVRPNTELAEKAGIELGETGAIKVDKHLRTSAEDIYAVGDVAESKQMITGKPLYHPLGSTANKMGRIVGDQLTGGNLEFKGSLGTGIFRIFNLAVAQTGLSAEEAEAAGYDPIVNHNLKPAFAEYLGGELMIIKSVADRKTGRLLGAQIVGTQGVDKRIDVLATALTFKANAKDLFSIDLAYAPPFSTTKDPVHYTGMALENSRSRLPMVTPQELVEKQANGEDIQVIDVRNHASYEKRHVKGAVSIPMPTLRKEVAQLDRSKPTVVYCNKGVTSNTAQNLLLNVGFKEVYALSGGHTNYQYYMDMQN